VDIEEPVVAIVVAAGSGVRLGGEGPKALRLLAGRPLVAWSLDAMAAGGAAARAGGGRFTQALYDAVVTEAPLPVTVVAGGPTRQQSVAHGLAALPADAAVVLVHDAARPLVPASVVAEVVRAAHRNEISSNRQIDRATVPFRHQGFRRARLARPPPSPTTPGLRPAM
jgi:2-C-methyl-D-erythritol 4-phosphate cytidylyltransferase